MLGENGEEKSFENPNELLPLSRVEGDDSNPVSPVFLSFYSGKKRMIRGGTRNHHLLVDFLGS